MVHRWIDLSCGSEFVHHLWQKFGQERGSLRRINSHLCCQRPHLIGSQTVLNLAGGDGLVFTEPDPRGEDISTTALRKLVSEPLQSPTLLQETAKNSDERIRAARSFCFSANRTKLPSQEVPYRYLLLVVSQEYPRNKEGESDISRDGSTTDPLVH